MSLLISFRDAGKMLSPNRVFSPVAMIFYVGLGVILLVCLPQIRFLVTEYWFIEDWISKGPIIWLVCIVFIHRDLASGDFKNMTSIQDLVVCSFSSLFLIAVINIEPLLAPITMIMLAWYLCAPAVAFSRLLISWLFLLLSLPYFSETVPGMQMLTVVVTENLLGILSIPVLVQEYYIAIPGGQFFVEEGCSGFSYMATNLLLLFLYALIGKFGLRSFIYGFLVAVSLALLVNWVRVVLIIVFAHNFGIEHEFVGSHGNFGWYLYVPTLFPFFYLFSRIENSQLREDDKPLREAKVVLALPPVLLLILPLVLVGWYQW